MRAYAFFVSAASGSRRSPDDNTGRADVVFGSSWMAVQVTMAVSWSGVPPQVKRRVTRSPRAGNGSGWWICTPS
jgi:hypothetical protein